MILCIDNDMLRLVPLLYYTPSSVTWESYLTSRFFFFCLSYAYQDLICTILEWCLQVGNSQRVKGADYALESIHNIREALPELWVAGKISSEVGNYDKVAVETSVTA